MSAAAFQANARWLTGLLTTVELVGTTVNGHYLFAPLVGDGRHARCAHADSLAHQLMRGAGR